MLPEQCRDPCKGLSEKIAPTDRSLCPVPELHKFPVGEIRKVYQKLISCVHGAEEFLHISYETPVESFLKYCGSGIGCNEQHGGRYVRLFAEFNRVLDRFSGFTEHSDNEASVGMYPNGLGEPDSIEALPGGNAPFHFREHSVAAGFDPVGDPVAAGVAHRLEHFPVHGVHPAQT